MFGFGKSTENEYEALRDARDARQWREMREKEIEARKKIKARLNLKVTLIDGSVFSEEYVYEYHDLYGYAMDIANQKIGEAFGRNGKVGVKFGFAFVPFTSILKVEHKIEEMKDLLGDMQ